MNAEQPELELGIEFPQQEGDLRILVADLVAEVDKQEFTPYMVHVIVNLALEAVGTEYRVRPQMMYNYDRNGMVVRGHKDVKRFNPEQVIDFVTRFVERNRNR